MARFTHLPIYKKSFWLLVMIEQIVMNMQRKSRYTIWEDLRTISKNFVISIARVNSMELSERKKEILYMFDLINQIYIMLWVMKELQLFQNKNQYENIILEVVNIEKQLEWWKNIF